MSVPTYQETLARLGVVELTELISLLGGPRTCDEHPLQDLVDGECWVCAGSSDANRTYYADQLAREVARDDRKTGVSREERRVLLGVAAARLLVAGASA